MKRRYKFLSSLILSILLIQISIAQTDPICNVSDPNPDPPGVYSYSDDITTLTSFDPIVFNVFYWGINRTNGSSANPLTLDQALEATANLNLEFNQYKIFFKFRGIDHINKDAYYEVTAGPGGELGAFGDYVELNHEVSNAFNIYVPFDFTNFGGYANYSRKSLGVDSFHITDNVVIHEMGHAFELIHTNDGHGGNFCERVTRVSSDPEYNADTHGDKVIDTAAIDNAWGAIDGNCLYDGDGKDCAPFNGTPYEIFERDTKNYLLTAALVYDCADSFTPGQVIRMTEAILHDKYNEFSLAQTPVSALYEPYQGEYYLAGPTLPIHTPLFQPGFDYTFIECCCDYTQPSDYYDISFSYNNFIPIAQFSKYEQDYETIIHPNHSAIHIAQIEGAINNDQPRKCYDNNNLAPSKGSVIRFNDYIVNTNYTLIPKDSLGINDKNLIRKLREGLYKIEKNYDNGTSEEVIIYKGNN